MRLPVYTASDFVSAFGQLLPPGRAWAWPEGGFGRRMLTGVAQELVRVDSQAQDVLDTSVRVHTPKPASWSVAGYRAVAEASQPAASAAAFAVGLSVHVPRPFHAGSRAGGRCWSVWARYLLVVNYSPLVTDLAALRQALDHHRQAHTTLLFSTDAAEYTLGYN